MSAPAVSVIVPAWNCRDLVGQAVESVRAQTYTDYELLVVDDGSTDGTPEVLERLAAGFPRMRVIRAPHRGLAAARNRAIAQMRGQTIALLDADDLWKPQKLQRCMDFLAENPELSVVYTPMAPVTLDGTVLEGHSKPCRAGRLTADLFESIFIHDPAAVFHRRVVDTVGGFDESLPVCVGHEFWLRVSTKFAIGLIDEPLALRRWSEGSLTRSNRARGRVIKAGMLERFYFERGGRDLVAAGPALRRLAQVHYSAGKILLRQGQRRQARTYLGKALTYDRWHFKARLLHWLAAATSPLERPAKP